MIARGLRCGVAAVALFVGATSTTATPAYAAAPVSRVVVSCRASSTAALAAVGTASAAKDLNALLGAATALAKLELRCANHVRHASAPTSRARCARTVAARGFSELATVGSEIQTGIGNALHSGNAADASRHLARANSLIDEGRTEVDLAPQVLSGHRGCASGRAAALKLSSATLRQLPALAAAVAQMTRNAEGQVLPEDQATFGLLVYHLDTGVPPPAAAVGAALSRIQGEIPSSDTWRIPGFRTFWVQYTTVDWTRYHLDAALLISEFQTYLGYKRNAELNASNQLLGGIVGSEQAWENALGSWKATEQRWYTADQASIAEYDAYRTSIDADKVLAQAAATLQNG